MQNLNLFHLKDMAVSYFPKVALRWRNLIWNGGFDLKYYLKNEFEMIYILSVFLNS